MLAVVADGQPSNPFCWTPAGQTRSSDGAAPDAHGAADRDESVAVWPGQDGGDAALDEEACGARDEAGDVEMTELLRRTHLHDGHDGSLQSASILTNSPLSDSTAVASPAPSATEHDSLLAHKRDRLLRLARRRLHHGGGGGGRQRATAHEYKAEPDDGAGSAPRPAQPGLRQRIRRRAGRRAERTRAFVRRVLARLPGLGGVFSC